MVNPMVQVLAAWAGALGFSILFNLRGKKLFWVSLGGLLVWADYDRLHLIFDSDYVCCFGAAAILQIYAECMARRQKTPVTVFLVAAMIPMIPGGPLYHTMEAALRQEWKVFADQGLSTLLFTLGIAGGVLCVTAVFSLIRRGLSGFPATRCSAGQH